MIILDYIYYQLTNLYNYFNKDGAGKAYGVVMTCVLPCWNLVLLIMISNYYFNTNVAPLNKYILLLYSLPIALLIGLRYWKYTSYEEIEEKVQYFSKTTKIIANIILTIYVLSSLFGLIGFAAYVGITRHR